MSLIAHQPDSTPAPLERRHRWITLLTEVAELSHAIANTDFVPKAMRGNEAAITAAILYGDEVGLSPMQSLAKIAVIDGKPSIAAEAQRALILAAGHHIWPEEIGTTKVTWAGRRHDFDQVTRVTWTLDDAKRAGLAGKPNWRTYPRAMLSARASAELARGMFADVIGGLAATEELDDGAEPTPAPGIADTEPAAKTRRRRTKPAAAVIAPDVPAAPDSTSPPEPPLPDEEQPAPKASEAQMRKLFAMFRERGMSDRTERLEWANQHLELPITSASQLTDLDASRLIDALDEIPAQAAEEPEPPDPDW